MISLRLHPHPHPRQHPLEHQQSIAILEIVPRMNTADAFFLDFITIPHPDVIVATLMIPVGFSKNLARTTRHVPMAISVPQGKPANACVMEVCRWRSVRSTIGVDIPEDVRVIIDIMDNKEWQ